LALGIIALHERYFDSRLIFWLLVMGLPRLAQWLILRRQVPWAWLWVPASVVVGMVIFGLIIRLDIFPSNIIFALSLGALHGSITGLTMVFLLAQPQVDKAKIEAA
jgi:hypothetical protein